MKKIKKYNFFEAYGWESDFESDWKSSWKSEWEEPSGNYLNNKYLEVDDYSMARKVPIDYYLDYIQVGDYVYHIDFRWGSIRKLIKRNSKNFIFNINFENSTSKDIMIGPSSSQNMYISINLANYIKEIRMKKNIIEPTNAEEKDIKILYDELQKKYNSLNNNFLNLVKSKEKNDSIISDLKRIIIELSDKNKKMEKQLDEYEGLKDAMIKFKGQIDPFDEETWTKKK